MDYYGQPIRSLENRFLRLDYLAQAGPRLVRLVPAGSQVNLLAETPEKSWATAAGEFHIWGGHRLWHSPEKHARTDIPDDAGLIVEELDEGAVRLSMPADASGLFKSIAVHLDPEQAALTLEHTLRNDGLWPVETAPWAITQVPLGGQAIIPNTAPPPPGESLLPDRLFVFWPYASLQDPRLHLGDDFVRIDSQPRPEAFKIGLFAYQGWVGHVFDNYFLRKSFTPFDILAGPDFGCNVEVWVQDRFLEIETLGPMSWLEPGDEVSHTETWEVLPRAAAP
jgi:hypothetical protein